MKTQPHNTTATKAPAVAVVVCSKALKVSKAKGDTAPAVPSED